MDYYNDQQVDIEEELTYNNQAYYMPRLVLDRSKYAKGEKIPVVSIINHNITKDGDKVAKHDTVKTMMAASQQGNPYMEQKPHIDDWRPQTPEDAVFTHTRGMTHSSQFTNSLG